MLTIQDYRRLLGAKAERMTDEEVSRCRDTFYALADTLTDRFMEQSENSANDR